MEGNSMGIGFLELLLILLAIFLVFGGKKVPEIMGAFGKGIRTFKKSMESDEESPARKDATTSPKELPPGNSGQDKNGSAQSSKDRDISKRDSSP